MSYILDALKKSEQERKLGGLPDISSEHHVLQSKQDKNLVLYFTSALIFILVIALAFFIASYIKNNNTLTTDKHFETNAKFNNQKSNTQSFNETNKSQAKFVQDFSLQNKQDSESERDFSNESLEIIRPNKERRDALQKDLQSKHESDEKLKNQYREIFVDKTTPKKPHTNQAQLDNSESALGNEDTNSDDGEVLEEELEEQEESEELVWDDYESIAALDPRLKQQIPSIKVSTHIYSSVESYRKVTINGFSVRKGAEISEGLVLEYIFEEGVVFSFKGVYFRMKALEEWEG